MKKGIVKKCTVKNIALDLLFDILGAFMYSLGIYTFAKSADFAPGGISGLALILNKLFDLPVGITTFVINIPLILISMKFVGKIFLIKTFKTMIFCTLFLDVIFPLIPIYSGLRFMSAVYSGIFIGIGLALFYMRGSSSGGTDFITMSVKVVKPHFSIGGVTMLIDLAVILLGWPVFGNIDSILYGLTSTMICSIVIDKIMYGFNAGTLLIIVTDNGKKVADSISELIGRGSTKLHAEGTFTENEKEILLCACSKSQTYIAKNAAVEIDKNAFVMITETNEVFGEGFNK